MLADDQFRVWATCEKTFLDYLLLVELLVVMVFKS